MIITFPLCSCNYTKPLQIIVLVMKSFLLFFHGTFYNPSLKIFDFGHIDNQSRMEYKLTIYEKH